MPSLIKKALWMAAGACLLFFLADRVLFFKPGFLERTAAKITYPLFWASGGIASTIRSIVAKKDSYNTLQTKYDKLYTDYMSLLDDVISLQANQRVYEATKELVEFKERYNVTHALLAKILVKNIASNEHYFLINRGSRDGITKDQVAIYQNHLIGRVSDVYDFYSKVVLITDQHCKVAAYTSKTHADGIVHGYNNITRCKLTYVSHLFKIQDNDLVISSGQGLVFPEGFCLGKIVSHSLQEKSLYHVIEIEPMINLETLGHCLIVGASTIKPL